MEKLHLCNSCGDKQGGLPVRLWEVLPQGGLTSCKALGSLHQGEHLLSRVQAILVSWFIC